MTINELVHEYVIDRQLMNAYYGMYKEHSGRVKSWESRIAGAIATKPLSPKEKKHLHDLIDGAEWTPPKEEGSNDEPF